jgi:PAS domain S-box-containing protein
MERYREELKRIRNLLRAHPRGLTVTDIARHIGVNRNSVAKYLDVLITAGHVEKEAVGPAKVYFLSPGVPVTAMLNLSSDYIIMLDEKRKIWYINNSLLTFEGRTREEVLGQDLDEVPLILLQDPEIRGRLSRGVSEGEFSTEVHVKKGEDMCHFRATLVCTILENGGRGTTIILEDITEEKRHEESLRASEARYRAVVESQTEFVCRFLPDGTHIFVNEAYCNYFGKRREEIEGHIFRPRIPDEDREPLRRHFENLTQEHPVGAIEHRIVMPDGTVRWQRWSDRAIFDEKGRVTEYQSVGWDTTDRRLSEERLRESEEKFRGVAERSFDIIFLFDEEGRSTYVSPSLQNILGISPEKVIGVSFREFIAPEDLPRAIQSFERNRDGLPTEAIRVRVKKPDGTLATIETNATPIIKEGRFMGIQAVSRDITARLQMEAALQESEEKFRSIAERAFDIILLTDEEGRISYASPALRQSLGYDPEEVIGKRYLEFIPTDDLPRATRSFERIAQGLPSQGVEIEVKRKDGSIAILEIRGTPIMREGIFRGLQAICRDITARKASDEALRRSEEKIRSLFEASSNGVCLVDEDGIIIKANRAVEEISGIPREEAIGRPIWEIAHRMLVPEYLAPNFLEMMRSDVQRLLGTGRSSHLLDADEHPIQRPDGTRRTIQVRNFLIPHEKGYRMGSIIQDITDRKKMEDDLRNTARDLGERVKELQCLFSISSLLNRQDLPFGSILQGVSDTLPSGMRFPGQCSARIRMEGQDWRSPGFSETPRILSQVIQGEGGPLGSIDVCYASDISGRGEPLFLHEERQLLEEIALRLAEAKGRHRSYPPAPDLR